MNRLVTASALLLAACTGSGRTEILIEVGSDLFVPDELDRVSISATGPDGRVQSASAALGPGEIPLPRVLGMVHTTGALGPYAVSIRGERDGSVVVQRDAQLTFQAGRTLLYRVDLLRECIDVTCESGQTCALGGCRSIEVAANELTTWNGQPFPQDAAAFDACVPDERCNDVDDDCDGNVDEGFDFTSDELNCGGCAIRCAQPHTSASCVAGQCAIQSCEAPWADCDGMGSNGCETDTSTSLDHCGSCTNACRPPDRACCSSVCGRC